MVKVGNIKGFHHQVAKIYGLKQLNLLPKTKKNMDFSGNPDFTWHFKYGNFKFKIFV